MRAMSDFEFDDEGQPWLGSVSGLVNCSDSCQFLSIVDDCPAPVLLNLGSEIMSDGLDTSLFSDLMDDGDAFLELLDDSLLQEYLLEVPPPIVGYEDPGDNNRVVPDAHQSIEHVLNPETNPVSSAVSRSATARCRWPNFVWLICACNRFSYAAAAAAASLRAKVPQTSSVLKGVMKKKDKYVCEMRVMMKMQKEKNKSIGKVWLGTYKTQAQAALALDVGKFFFNGKESKSFYNPDSETVLSKLSYLLAQPLEELVKSVKKLAKHYGEHGSVQNFVL